MKLKLKQILEYNGKIVGLDEFGQIWEESSNQWHPIPGPEVDLAKECKWKPTTYGFLLMYQKEMMAEVEVNQGGVVILNYVEEPDLIPRIKMELDERHPDWRSRDPRLNRWE